MPPRMSRTLFAIAFIGRTARFEVPREAWGAPTEHARVAHAPCARQTPQRQSSVRGAGASLARRRSSPSDPQRRISRRRLARYLRDTLELARRTPRTRSRHQRFAGRHRGEWADSPAACCSPHPGSGCGRPPNHLDSRSRSERRGSDLLCTPSPGEADGRDPYEFPHRRA